MQLKKDRIQYEIVYDQYNSLYFMAQVTYQNNRPSSWEKVEINGHTLNRLSGKIERCFSTYLDTQKMNCINIRGTFIRGISVRGKYGK